MSSWLFRFLRKRHCFCSDFFFFFSSFSFFLLQNPIDFVHTFSTRHFGHFKTFNLYQTWAKQSPYGLVVCRTYTSWWRHHVSRDSALKGQISLSNYEETVWPICFKLCVYLSREVLYPKIAMTSSWRHRPIFYNLLKFCIFNIVLMISCKRNKIFSNFFFINLKYTT